MTEKLTAVKVKNLGPGVHGDGNGLWLRVVTAERRSWLFRYQRHGKAREMGLGGFPAVSLAAARDKAQAARQQLANDIDPFDHRAAERQAEETQAARAITFAEAANRRGDLIAKRRALMDDWANYLAKPAARVVHPRFGRQQAAHEAVA